MSGPRLAGKVAVVVGGDGGLGAAVAGALAAAGAVVLSTPAPHGDREIADAVDRAVGRHGGLHILCCAGSEPVPVPTVSGGRPAPSGVGADGTGTGPGPTLGGWDDAMTADVRRVTSAINRAAAPMVAAGGGSIITTVSTRALSGDTVDVAGAAADSAVLTFTRAAAVTLGRSNVRANVVAAGPLDTPAARSALPADYLDAIVASNLIPRLARPDDIAGLVVFLASDGAAYITGQVMRVDGGQLAHLPHYAHMIATGSTTTGGTPARSDDRETET